MDFSDTTVIMPTLDEEGNIGRILDAMTRYKGISIIVSDDGSSDGTIKEVLKAGKGNSRIRLLRRKGRERGLTASVIDAVALVRTAKTIVMDADFQHPPEKVKEIAAKLDDFDLVVGVRTHVKNWGAWRQFVSGSVALMAYVAFRMRGKATCDDMMSGFFGIRTALMKRLIRRKEGFVVPGMKILLDIMRMSDKGVRLGQVSYSTFHGRMHGESKLGVKHVVYTLRSIYG